MILMRILPGILKELSKHVPTVLFQTVEWSELASELPRITRRMLHKEGHMELFMQQKEFLSPLHITLHHSPLTEHSMDGHKLLQLFFAQLNSPHGLFLDLRSHHFNNETDGLSWHPSHFWTKFDEGFRCALLDVYEGFYLELEDKYLSGLERIGLIKKEWSEQDKQELAHLFRSQFGNNEMIFDLEELQQGMVKMSHFMLDKKVHISKDFLYLGIYLVTLYSSLEKTKKIFNVKDIYLETKNLFSA